MAGFIVATSSLLRAPVGYVKSSENANFPASNVGTRYAYRPWKSSANLTSGTTFVGVDLGAQLTVAAVFIDAINCASIEIQASNASNFSPNDPSVTLTVARNRVSGRYKLLYLTAGTALNGLARQYWRALARTSTDVNGAGPSTVPMSVGNFSCWSGYVTWPMGVATYDETPIEATTPNSDFAGGGSEPVILGNRYGVITLGTAPASRALMRDNLLDLFGEGIGRWFLFYKNAGDTADAYRCRRAGDVTLRQPNPSTIQFQSCILEETT